MIKRLFIILVIIIRVWNLSGCVDNIVLSPMSIKSPPVAGKFDRENVKKATSEADIKGPEEIKRSVRVKKTVRATKPKEQEHCSTRAKVALVPLQSYKRLFKN